MSEEDFKLSKNSLSREFFDCGYDQLEDSKKALIDARFEQVSKPMRATSPWSDHLKIAIRSWARERARNVAEKALKVPARNQDMEYFLECLLTDALLTFNDDYMRCYNEQIQRMERLLTEAQNTTIVSPMLARLKREG